MRRTWVELVLFSSMHATMSFQGSSYSTSSSNEKGDAGGTHSTTRGLTAGAEEVEAVPAGEHASGEASPTGGLPLLGFSFLWLTPLGLRRFSPPVLGWLLRRPLSLASIRLALPALQLTLPAGVLVATSVFTPGLPPVSECL